MLIRPQGFRFLATLGALPPFAHPKRFFTRQQALTMAILAAVAAKCPSQQLFMALHPPLGATAQGAPSTVAAGDIDGDGDQDLVASMSSGLFAFLNDGAGAFAPPLVLATTFATELQLGDFDNDGDLDLLAASPSGTRLYRNTAGAFTDVTGSSIPRRGDWRATAGDVDGDGDVDIVAADWTSLRLLRNDGTGVFADVTAGNLPSSSQLMSAGALAFGDVDGDGDADLVIGNWDHYAPQHLLYRNNGSGTFQDVTGLSVPLGWDSATATALGDVDGDGDIDIVFNTGRYAGRGQIYINNGQGLFSFETSARLPAVSFDNSDVSIGDVDGDGDLDLCFAGTGNCGPFGCSQGGQDRIYLNDGTGHFTDASAALPQQVAWSDTNALADLDGDGDLDLVSGMRIWSNLRWQLQAVTGAHVGRAWTLDAHVRYAPPTNHVAAIFLSTTRIHVPVPPFGVLGIDPMAPLPLITIPSGSGTGNMNWTVPNLPQAIGVTIHAQALFVTATSLDRLSNVVTTVIAL